MYLRASNLTWNTVGTEYVFVDWWVAFRNEWLIAFVNDWTAFLLLSLTPSVLYRSCSDPANARQFLVLICSNGFPWLSISLTIKAKSVQWQICEAACDLVLSVLSPTCFLRAVPQEPLGSPGRAGLSPALRPSFPHSFLTVTLQSPPSFNLPFSLSFLSFRLSLYHHPT